MTRGMEKLDGRKLHHKTREAMRIRAVQRIQAGESPEVVIKALGFNRSVVYGWLKRFEQRGVEPLKLTGIPGKTPKLAKEQLRKLCRIITDKNPLHLNFEFTL